MLALRIVFAAAVAVAVADATIAHPVADTENINPAIGPLCRPTVLELLGDQAALDSVFRFLRALRNLPPGLAADEHVVRVAAIFTDTGMYDSVVRVCSRRGGRDPVGEGLFSLGEEQQLPWLFNGAENDEDAIPKAPYY